MRHTKIKLLGFSLMLFGSLGIFLLAFYWFPSVFPKARTPAPTTTLRPITLTQHTVSVDSQIQKTLSASPTTTVLIYMDRPTNLKPVTSRDKTRLPQERTTFYNDLKTQTARIQDTVKTKLKPIIDQHHLSIKKSFFVDNIFLADIDAEALEALTNTPGIISIIPDAQIPLPPLVPSTTTATPEWNLTKIGADRVWNELGITGQGVVVANIDTGVQWDHPALKSKYRGWNGVQASHDYNWYDPTNTSPSNPIDNNNHGTHTMGIMVGSDASNTIGVAPDAKWIAAKGCASNYCVNSDLLAAGQWILAPTKIDGSSPDPTKAPNVVNNSWGGGNCDSFYRGMMTSWVNAGIVPIFSAGNNGPGIGSINSPGDNPESFAVGATDSSDTIAYFSSKGPTCIPFGSIIKPNVSAPGVSIRSSIPTNNYATFNGTSMAAPHVAALVALLLQAKPTLSVYELETIISNSASDLGNAGIDNTYGSGRIDAYKAVTMVNIPISTPTPTPVKTIQVISPNGGETITVGTKITITWTSSNVSYVHVSLIDSTGYGTGIIQNLPNTNSYEWTVSNTYHPRGVDQFKIKLYDAENLNIIDTSDTFFTIPYNSNYSRVFITSTKYTGNLGGLAGADAKCQERANYVGLGGTWKAWLSDSNNSASSRLEHFDGQYQLVNGAVVAQDWADLTDGTIQTPINVDEGGRTPSAQGCVWTSTKTNGSGYSPQGNVTLCNDYTSADSNYSMCGHNGTTSSSWTDWTANPCNYASPIYCFEQMPIPPTPTNTPTPTLTPTPTTTLTPTPTTSPTPTNTPTSTPTNSPTTTPTPTLDYCLTGDINKDGTVNSLDVNLLLADFFSTNPTNPRTDLNRDGIVDITDYSFLVLQYNISTGPCL